MERSHEAAGQAVESGELLKVKEGYEEGGKTVRSPPKAHHQDLALLSQKMEALNRKEDTWKTERDTLERSFRRALSAEGRLFREQLAAREEAFKKEPSSKEERSTKNKLTEKQEDYKKELLRSTSERSWLAKIRDSERSRRRRKVSGIVRTRTTTMAGWLLLVWLRMDSSRLFFLTSSTHTLNSINPSYSIILLPPATPNTNPSCLVIIINTVPH